jgi:hypothetical protein
MPLTVAQAVQRARQEMAQLTGQPIASVVSCAQQGQGWRVVLETLERKAVPDSSDLLATYEVLMDGEGTLTTFQRLRVRRRGQTMEEERQE